MMEQDFLCDFMGDGDVNWTSCSYISPATDHQVNYRSLVILHPLALLQGEQAYYLSSSLKFQSVF